MLGELHAPCEGRDLREGATLYLAPTADSREEWQSTIRHIALEGRCFVISVNQYVNKSIYPADLACYGDLKDLPEEMCSGGSAILGPLGSILQGRFVAGRRYLSPTLTSG